MPPQTTPTQSAFLPLKPHLGSARIILAFSLVGIVLTGCAGSQSLNMGSGYQPILDGPASATYRADLAACQQLAADQSQFDQETLAAAALGAGAGALLGIADDSMSDEEGAFGGAIVGAVVGGAAGWASATERREAIVVRCLQGRGHRVVG